MSLAWGRDRFPQALRDGRLRVCQRREIRPWERVAVVGSGSEASMHAGVTDRIVEVVLYPTRRRRLYEAHLYEPGASEPFANWLTEDEAGVYQDDRGRLWMEEPVEPLVVAGWDPARFRRGAALETDRWEEAGGWLARRVDDQAQDFRFWAGQAAKCTGRPPCDDCSGVCWRQAAGELTSLAETLQEPPPEPGWSQTAAGGRYWITRTGEQS